MKTLIRSALGLAAVVGVSGCQTPPNFGEPETTFGAAVRHNIATQTVDPHPQNAMPPPGHDAHRAARSIERYLNDRVKRPAEIRTSDTGASGGGGGSQ